MPKYSSRIFIFGFEGVQLIDISGPAQVFSTANMEQATPPYLIDYFGHEGAIVKSASGLPIQLNSLEDDVDGGTLILPGGPGVASICRNKEAIKLIQKVGERVNRVCSVCTGAFIAAEAGFLDNKRAVTHWRACANLKADYPQVHVEEDPLYIRDGHVWTSAGVTAGIDLALALVEDDHNTLLAARIARRLVVYLRRGGGQKQFSDPLQLQFAESKNFGGLIEKINEFPTYDWSIEKMAETVGQSSRTFHRKFLLEVGKTPGEVVAEIRCSIARNLLQTTKTNIDHIAYASGFKNANNLRRALQRQYKLTPKMIRQ